MARAAEVSSKPDSSTDTTQQFLTGGPQISFTESSSWGSNFFYDAQQANQANSQSTIFLQAACKAC